MGAVVEHKVLHISEADPDFAVIPQDENFLRVDLACGDRKREGFVGVDIAPLPSVDIVCDLSVFPWPFKDGEVGEMNASHYIEHVASLIDFFNEAHRVMAPNGLLHIAAPYYSSMRAWQDPTHRNAISEASFAYYSQKWLKENRLEHYRITADFEMVACRYVFSPEFVSRSSEALEYARKHSINVVNDIEVTLRAIK